MVPSIKQAIYLAVLSNKWLDVEYVNAKKEKTRFCVGVKDIDSKKQRLFCDIFNAFLSNRALQSDHGEIYINIGAITRASVIEQSYYLSGEELANRIAKDPNLSRFLEADELDNNILCYLSDCYKFDNDPYLKESVVLDGIDIKELREKRHVPLEEEQFSKLLDVLFKRNRYDAEQMYRYVDLAINSFSIDIHDKQYVVAYYPLTLNFKDRTLHAGKNATINKSFLLDEDQRVSLGTYLDMDPEVFCEEYDEKKRDLISQIEENYNNGEKTNTRPTIFLIERKTLTGVDQAFEAINEMERLGSLPYPIRSFFGRNRPTVGTKKEASIVVFDKTKVNIDQMRVVYNAMVNHVTYVQGPPGTGKTETIFNVILSAYANGKKVLICSNNNHPIDDIAKRLSTAFDRDNRYGESHTRLPFIRLGNMMEMIKAIGRLRKDLELAKKFAGIKANETYTRQNLERSVQSFEELRDLLMHFEERAETKERSEALYKMLPFAKTETIEAEIRKQINVLDRKMKSIPFVKNEDLGKYMISASEDRSFQDFINYSSILSLKKLLSPTNKDLRDILAIEDPQTAAISFGKYLKEDENLRRFMAIYPIIVCTNQSCEKFGSPKPHFDLCIMDEAGQCNVATSLIPIIRADDLLLVGDTNQLQPVTVIEASRNEKFKAKYGIKPEYDYMKNSILSTMRAKDTNSKSIMLRYHYRCGKKIAGFSNQRFYDGALKLEKQDAGELIYCDVQNQRFLSKRNSYAEEALAVVDLIEKNGYKDVGIITPFVNQAALINHALDERGIKDVTAGTIHTLQGSEKSTIIFSAALSTRTGKKTMEWVKNNHELINVGVTRAKQRLIFVGDKGAIDAQSGKETNDIKALSDYIYSQGKYVVPRIEDRSFSDFSNDSASEKEFFETVTPYFRKKKNKMRIERNVPVRKAIQKVRPEDVARIGKKEFDVVVQVADGLFGRNYRTIVAFEIDGGEHVGNTRTAMRDRQKEEVCKSYGIKLIRIANHQVKDYELIIALFECVIKQLPDIEQIYVQGTLFDNGENKELTRS